MSSVKTAPANNGYFSFGDLSNYSGGGAIPEGDYAIWWDLMLYKPEDKPGQKRRRFTEERLGVMLTVVNLREPLDAEGKVVSRTQFVSFGGSAKDSFTVDETGKRLIPIPNAPAFTLNNMTNWFHLLKSLYDCAMPHGYLGDDFSVLDGCWAHIANVPEPEDRKQFANTGRAAMSEVSEEPRGNMTMPIITTFHEGGRPWMGEAGGTPNEPLKLDNTLAAAAPAAVPAKVAPPARAAAPAPTARAAAPAPSRAAAPAPARPAVAARPAPAIAASAVATATITEDELLTAALEAAGSVIDTPANKAGMTKIKLRMDVVKMVKEKYGEETGALVADTYFNTDANIDSLVGQLGYAVQGISVKPNQ